MIEEKDGRRLDFLLAEYQAIKAEIARRSGLQERALALYLVAIAVVVSQVMNGSGFTLPAVVAWMAAMLTLMYDVRERYEIVRLGALIRERIAKPAAAVLGVHAGQLVPSEVWEADPKIDLRTRRLEVVFRFLCFAIVPLVITGLGYFLTRERLGSGQEFKLTGVDNALLMACAIVALVNLGILGFFAPYDSSTETQGDA